MDHAIEAKIWYVEEGTSPKSDIFVNAQRHMDPGHFVAASTLFPVPGKENTDPCNLGQQSDIFVNAQRHLETRNPGHFVAASTLFPVPGKENTR